MTTPENRSTDAPDAANQRMVRVLNPMGLHARPAGKLAQAAQAFAADIRLVQDGQVVDAKSILDVLTLAAEQGSELLLTAEGEDAPTALDRLQQMFANQFKDRE